MPPNIYLLYTCCFLLPTSYSATGLSRLASSGGLELHSSPFVNEVMNVHVSSPSNRIQPPTSLLTLVLTDYQDEGGAYSPPKDVLSQRTYLPTYLPTY